MSSITTLIRNLYFGLIIIGTIGPMLYFGYRRFEIAEMNRTQPALATLQGGLVALGNGGCHVPLPYSFAPDAS